jgi:hypothetical protein
MPLPSQGTVPRGAANISRSPDSSAARRELGWHTSFVARLMLLTTGQSFKAVLKLSRWRGATSALKLRAGLRVSRRRGVYGR